MSTFPIREDVIEGREVASGDVATKLGYPIELASDVNTRIGVTLKVRPMGPGDACRMVSFHQHLSPDSVYRRFFFVHPGLSTAEVERFTNVDYIDRLLSSWRTGPTGRRHGIGALMLERLADAGWRSGITTTAQTLAGNTDMLSLFKDSGFPVSSCPEDGVEGVRFPIEPDDTYRAACSRRHAVGQDQTDDQGETPRADR